MKRSQLPFSIIATKSFVFPESRRRVAPLFRTLLSRRSISSVRRLLVNRGAETKMGFAPNISKALSASVGLSRVSCDEMEKKQAGDCEEAPKPIASPRVKAARRSLIVLLMRARSSPISGLPASPRHPSISRLLSTPNPSGGLTLSIRIGRIGTPAFFAISSSSCRTRLFRASEDQIGNHAARYRKLALNVLAVVSRWDLACPPNGPLVGQFSLKRWWNCPSICGRIDNANIRHPSSPAERQLPPNSGARQPIVVLRPSPPNRVQLRNRL